MCVVSTTNSQPLAQNFKFEILEYSILPSKKISEEREREREREREFQKKKINKKKDIEYEEEATFDFQFFLTEERSIEKYGTSRFPTTYWTIKIKIF